MIQAVHCCHKNNDQRRKSNRSTPERISSFARSIPLVIKGKPGIIKSMAQMYPASCCTDTPHKLLQRFSEILHIQDMPAATEDTIPKKSVK